MKIRRFILLTFVFLMSASLVGCKEKTETEIISGNADKEEIIDKYFQAINDKDMIKIFTISYPNEALEVRGDGWKNWTADKTLAHYTRNLGFYRCLYEKEEFTTSVAIVAGSYPNGDTVEGAQETLDMLNVTYEIIAIHHLDDFYLVEHPTNGEHLALLDTYYYKDCGELIYN